MLAAPGPGRHSGRLAYVAAEHFGRGIRMNLRAKKWRWMNRPFLASIGDYCGGVGVLCLSIPDVDSGKELCPTDPISLPISFSVKCPNGQIYWHLGCSMADCPDDRLGLGSRRAATVVSS